MNKTIAIPQYAYGFPSNKVPSLLDNKKIVYESYLPVDISLSYSGDLLPEIKNDLVIQVSEHASIKLCRATEIYTLTSSRNKYTLFELANSVVQSVLTQKGASDVWHTYKLVLEKGEDCIILEQRCNH